MRKTCCALLDVLYAVLGLDSELCHTELGDLFCTLATHTTPTGFLGGESMVEYYIRYLLSGVSVYVEKANLV
jgi:hypothetical protein